MSLTFTLITSPRRGEVGARSATGEGPRCLRSDRSPSSRSSPRRGEGGRTRNPSGQRRIRRQPQLAPNDFQRPVRIGQYVMVPEADDAISVRFDHARARGVDRFIMLSAIKLDGDVRGSAGKVCNKRPNRKLTDELRAFQSSSAKVQPKSPLGVRTAAAEFAGDRRQAFFCQYRAPSSQPSPHRGEGVRSALVEPSRDFSSLNANSPSPRWGEGWGEGVRSIRITHRTPSFSAASRLPLLPAGEKNALPKAPHHHA